MDASATATATETATPTATPTQVPARLKVSPSPAKFGKVKVGTVKRSTLTLMNQAKKGPPITFDNPMTVFPPGSPQEFKSITTTCGAQLFPKKKCKLTLQFGPDSVGYEVLERDNHRQRGECEPGNTAEREGRLRLLSSIGIGGAY